LQPVDTREQEVQEAASTDRTDRVDMADGPGQLSVVSTPIGNLADITYRAVDTLHSADLILAEDTRHSRVLLEHYQIRTPMIAYHEHNEARETPKIIARLRDGAAIALISDAGTPLVSDPGARLVQACIAAQIPVVPVPGASALLSALVASGMSVERFTFWGFLARKGRERGETLDAIVRSPLTSVLYESPNRVRDTLAALAERGAGPRQCVVARELTKKFETMYRGTIDALLTQLEAELRGEVVLLVAGAEEERAVTDDMLRERAETLRAQGLSARDVVEHLMTEFGVARNLAYRIIHA
jgi:16S rRNA (cytidine1402-2'-O)-methyltransferase